MALLWKVSSVAGTGGWSVTGTGGLVSHRYWRIHRSQVLEVLSVTCTGATGAFVSHRWFRQSHVLESQVLSSITGAFVSHMCWSHRCFRQSQVLSSVTGTEGFVSHRYWRIRQ